MSTVFLRIPFVILSEVKLLFSDFQKLDLSKEPHFPFHVVIVYRYYIERIFVREVAKKVFF